MGQGWGIIITVVIFGVGQLAALGVLIFHLGSKFQQLNDLERRVRSLEDMKDAFLGAIGELKARKETAC